MCDPNDYAVGAMLNQSKDKKRYAISYTSKTLTGPQLNFDTMKKGTSCRGICHLKV
jgi:hypothetical protein